MAHLRDELVRYCRASWRLLEPVAPQASVDEIDRLADVAGQATETRITIMDDAGRVLGDSELNPSEIRAVENHRQRPEVRLALTEGVGGFAAVQHFYLHGHALRRVSGSDRGIFGRHPRRVAA
ncbi:MAG: hypothetical protein M5R36_23070 [Deltaproteobacteria bacterium]|nr:hypothetical protein [Deltaproteobacteria bacterium]